MLIFIIIVHLVMIQIALIVINLHLSVQLVRQEHT